MGLRVVTGLGAAVAPEDECAALSKCRPGLAVGGRLVGAETGRETEQIDYRDATAETKDRLDRACGIYPNPGWVSEDGALIPAAGDVIFGGDWDTYFISGWISSSIVPLTPLIRM